MILPASYSNGFAPRDGQPLYPELWSGCVGSWAPCLGPSGLTLRDWSGYGCHLDMVGTTSAAAWVARSGRYSFATTGGTDYAESSIFTQQPQGLTQASVGFWAQFSASASAIEMCVSFGVDVIGGKKGWYIYRSATGRAASEFGSGTGSATGTTTLAANTWYRIDATFDGAVNRIYVNGRLEASTSYSLTSWTGSRIVLGAYRDVSNLYSALRHNGFLDDVSVSKIVRAENQIGLLATRRGIAYELAPRRRSSVLVAASFNRRRRLLLGASN